MNVPPSRTEQASRYFELLGTTVSLCAPSELIEPLEVVFGWFASDAVVSPADLCFDISAEASGYRLELKSGEREEQYSLPTVEHVFGFVYARILDDVTRREGELLCVHGAALSRDGRGVVLAAPSQHGKSTLSLALASRGFEFLSDEVAAISLGPPTLHPFPMAIGCREGTFELLRGSVFENHRFKPFRFSGKMLYDPHADGSPVAAAPLHSVFFLETEDPSTTARHRYRLWLDPARPTIASSVRDIDGVEAAEVEFEGRSLVLTLRGGVWAAPEIEAAIAREGALVAGVEDLDAPLPDFSSKPQLTRLSASEGTVAMFRHLRGFGAVEELARKKAGGFPELMIDVASGVSSVAFHRVTPGKLPELIEIIERVVAG